MRSIYVVVETPKGHSEKFTFNKELNAFTLKKVLPAGMVFPFDFGFIPNTQADDDAPLDVMLLSEYRTFTGCVVDCRIIGAILAKQSKGKKEIRNDRYIAVPVLSQVYARFRNLAQIDPGKIEELKNFFIHYNEAENKSFEPFRLLNAKDANKLLKQYIIQP